MNKKTAISKLLPADIKLTDSQKKVIKDMRENGNVFAWRGIMSCYKYRDKTYRYDLGIDLLRKKLIQRGKNLEGLRASNYYYELTELGKTIEL